MINKIGMSSTFKSNLNNTPISNKSLPNEDSKRVLLQVNSDKLFKQHTIEHNSCTFTLIGVSFLSIIGLVSGKIEHKNTYIFSCVASAIGAIILLLNKPKKEEYDAQVQLDLNKEAANANSISK